MLWKFIVSRHFSMCFKVFFKNLRQINVYCNIKIILLWRIVSSNVEMTEILNLWLSQFKACPSPLGAFVKSCTSHDFVFLWWNIFMKDQPEGGEFVLFYLMYYSVPHLKMTISVLIYDSVIIFHWIVANSYQHRTNDLLTRSSKNNYERTNGELTTWLTTDDCLTVTIDGSKRTNYWLRVFIANNITA